MFRVFLRALALKYYLNTRQWIKTAKYLKEAKEKENSYARSKKKKKKKDIGYFWIIAVLPYLQRFSAINWTIQQQLLKE